jgi:hypothetical protein
MLQAFEFVTAAVRTTSYKAELIAATLKNGIIFRVNEHYTQECDVVLS